jgi:hypothetical protein
MGCTTNRLLGVIQTGLHWEKPSRKPSTAWEQGVNHQKCLGGLEKGAFGWGEKQTQYAEIRS